MSSSDSRIPEPLPTRPDGDHGSDDEVDADIGDMSLLTWVAFDGSEPAWAKDAGAGAGEPITLLSTPLPGDAASRLASDHVIVLSRCVGAAFLGG